MRRGHIVLLQCVVVSAPHADASVNSHPIALSVEVPLVAYWYQVWLLHLNRQNDLIGGDA